MNCAKDYSGIGLYQPNRITFDHNTFSNNIVQDSICISFYGGGSVINNINIIHNNSPSYGVVFVWGGGELSIHFSVFDNNEGNLYYCNTDSILNIFNSYIYHSGITSSINNNSLTKYSTYNHQFFKTHFCFAEYPAHTESKLTQIPIQITQRTKTDMIILMFLMTVL